MQKKILREARKCVYTTLNQPNSSKKPAMLVAHVTDEVHRKIIRMSYVYFSDLPIDQKIVEMTLIHFEGQHPTPDEIKKHINLMKIKVFAENYISDILEELIFEEIMDRMEMLYAEP